MAVGECNGKLSPRCQDQIAFAAASPALAADHDVVIWTGATGRKLRVAHSGRVQSGRERMKILNVWNVLSVCVMRLVCRPGVSMKILNESRGRARRVRSESRFRNSLPERLFHAERMSVQCISHIGFSSSGHGRHGVSEPQRILYNLPAWLARPFPLGGLFRFLWLALRRGGLDVRLERQKSSQLVLLLRLSIVYTV